jgi:hypothetical protein
MMAETNEQTLLERVEGLSGGDREVDALVCAALHYPELTHNDAALRVTMEAGEGGALIYYVADTKTHKGHAPKITSDVSAAIALCETVLPGWEWIVEKRKSTCNARVHTGYDSFDTDDGEIFEASASTPALALIAAVLKARAEALKEEG